MAFTIGLISFVLKQVNLIVISCVCKLYRNSYTPVFYTAKNRACESLEYGQIYLYIF